MKPPRGGLSKKWPSPGNIQIHNMYFYKMAYTRKKNLPKSMLHNRGERQEKTLKVHCVGV